MASLLETDINLETVPENLEEAIAARNLLSVVLYHVHCKGKFYKIKDIFHSSGSRLISHNQTCEICIYNIYIYQLLHRFCLGLVKKNKRG